MNVVNKDFNLMKATVDLAFKYIDLNSVPEKDIATLVATRDMIKRMEQKQRDVADRAWAYIKEKRKTDKNYARSYERKQKSEK